MLARSVPVSMGSPRFQTRTVRGCVVTRVWFPGGAILEPHLHERPTIAVVLRGGFELALHGPASRNRMLSCPAGTILSQPACERHTNFIGAEGALGIVLQPDAMVSETGQSVDYLMDRVHLLRDGLVAADAWRLAREVMTAAESEGADLALMAQELILNAAQSVYRKKACVAAMPSWLLRATDFIHAEFRSPLRVEDVAAVADVHPAHLAAVFRETHRMPLYEYLRRLRIEWAAERLVETRQPIVSIAIQAGFADQAHLTRWFRRVIGATPAAYRAARAIADHSEALEAFKT